MRTLKIALSVLALLVGALATAMTAGLFNVPPGAVGLVMAAAGFVSVLGIQPFPISAGIAKGLSAASVLLTSAQLWHASAVSTLPHGNLHPWIWVMVGFVAVMLGVIGKGPINHTPPTADDLPLIPPGPGVKT